MNRPVDVSIVMPCLNEAETLGACIVKAGKGCAKPGSRAKSSSPTMAARTARRPSPKSWACDVVDVRERATAARYWRNAGGARAGGSSWAMPTKLRFLRSRPFVEKFPGATNSSWVAGCRPAADAILPGAMPWKNRWLGNPVLSFIGRTFFQMSRSRFSLRLARLYSKDAFERMELQTTGMEFASEMVIKATFKKMRITEVPVTWRRTAVRARRI